MSQQVTGKATPELFERIILRRLGARDDDVLDARHHRIGEVVDEELDPAAQSGLDGRADAEGDRVEQHRTDVQSLDLDAVSPRLEIGVLEHSIEVVDNADVVHVGEHLRLRRRVSDPQAAVRASWERVVVAASHEQRLRFELRASGVGHLRLQIAALDVRGRASRAARISAGTALNLFVGKRPGNVVDWTASGASNLKSS